MTTNSKEHLQEVQYHFPYHHLSHEENGAFYLFRHLFWGLEHYTYIKFVIDKITENSPLSLADVGCGEGRILTELSKRLNSTKLSGYDISEAALHFARGFTDKPIFQRHDITESRLPEKFSAVVSCEVIEHIKPELVDSYCKNIAESLETNGVFFLTTPTTNVPVNAKHYQHFTNSILENCLSPYFIIEEVAYLNRVNFYYRVLNRLIANRWYISNSPTLNRWVLNQYKKHLLIGDEKTGSRIYIKAIKK